MSIKKSEIAAIYGNKLPVGCNLCFSGIKAVIFLTGLCNEKCFYCPVSYLRRNKDLIYVNERKIENFEEIFEEIERSGAKSASITGGEPLIVFDRTTKIIELLKQNFGSNFHIHLYTNGILINEDVLKKLEKAGLDELRIHPTIDGIEKKVVIAKKVTSLSVGVEIPSLPGKEEWMIKLAEFLDKAGADFLNINELEANETNIKNLRINGFVISDNGIVVNGSREPAMKVIEYAKKHSLKIPIHFCPAIFKDAVQTRNRFIITAQNDIKIYEKADGGLIKFGILEPESTDIEIEKFIDEGLIQRCRDSLCFHLDDLKKLKDLINKKGKAYVVEAHPTRERFIVNKSRLF
jgi:pyruvate formate-lyase activating enzyme-like uncharacterized protein